MRGRGGEETIPYCDEYVVGLDEAGRGPVVGPLILAAVCLGRKQTLALAEIGVRDSKRYGSGKKGQAIRAALSARIAKIAKVEIAVAPAVEVDHWVSTGGLNRLERSLASRILAAIVRPLEMMGSAYRLIADGNRIFSPLKEIYPYLEAHDRAESLHPAVAAASIVAKVERDQRLSAILAEYQPQFGPIGGGGYANQGTRCFLERFFAVHHRLPKEIRRTYNWQPLQQLIGKEADYRKEALASAPGSRHSRRTVD